jgi:hypothetical protein
MSAVLSECTIVEKRAVIQFFVARVVKPFEFHRRMLAQYRENCIMQMKAFSHLNISDKAFCSLSQRLSLQA